MDAAALLMVVAAACIHATWNLLSKMAHAGPVFVWCYSVVTTTAYAPLAAWILWHATQSITLAGWAALAASGALHLGYNLVLQRGYQAADLSVVYPVARGTGPLLSATAAFAIFGEAATLPRVAGMLLTVLGIAAIARIDRLLAPRRPGVLAGVGYGVATGGFIAAYTVVDAYAVKTLLIAPLIVDYLSGALRLAMLTPAAWLQRARIAALPARTWAYAAAVGVLSPIAYILVLTAMQRAPVSVVAPAREMSMMLAALMGTVLLREGDAARRLAGAGLILAGAALLVWH